MSEKFTITKCIEVDMEVTVYNVYCDECGEDLEMGSGSKTDSDGDLSLVVKPCQTCLDEAANKGEE